ncbi:MAG TPA: VOC family protein [Bacteroidia bacterium]|jgi:catechol 2,3-dioxygenase-like lactoylglutathione lyase family enzyme|nr:VOC family protein [Bacteroidia bacterium]
MLKITETNVTLMVMNLDKSIHFYESIGLKLKQRWDNHYAMIETTGLTIGLHPSEKPVKPSTQMSIGFMVDDIKEAKTILDKNKTTYSEDDGKSGIYLHFQDLDGTALYFTQPKWR